MGKREISVSSTSWIQSPELRHRSGLDGKWNIIVDPYRHGYLNYRRQPRSDGYQASRSSEPGGPPVEHDYDTSPTLNVPGDWNSQRPDLLYYEGVVWYRRYFFCTRRPGRRYFLDFGAVNYSARVWLNGHSAGAHQGGFTGFQLEVTELVSSGVNELVVMVDSTRRVESVPTLETDWWNYGGITRSVGLLEVPSTFIRDYAIYLDPDEPGHLVAWLRLDGTRLPETARIEVPELALVATAPVGSDKTARFRVAVRVERWEPGQPRLYEVRLHAGADRVVDEVGFRTVEVRGHDILLNGKPVFLRGISLHEEPLGEAGGRAHSEEQASQLLDLVEELGCNFVRLAHYPHREHMVRSAERRGLLVWSELPVYWIIDWANPETVRTATQQLEEMIARDKNRAAVVFWSLGNETPVQEERMRFLTGLCETARRLDSTRLLTAALEQSKQGSERVVDDPLGKYLDVLGLNQYIGWYDDSPQACAEAVWRLEQEKPVIASEFGAGAKFGLHGRDDERWTEEHQAAVYHAQIAMLERMPFLSGASPWILKDFRSPRRPLPKVQDGWNRKGLVSELGEKKLAFKVLERWYRELARGRNG